MSLWPTRGNENRQRHPREGGGPFFSPMDSRLRGNDVTFGRAARRLPARGPRRPVGVWSPTPRLFDSWTS